MKDYQPGQTEIKLSAEESRHAGKVLRKMSGSLIELTDGQGHFIQGVISGKTGKFLSIQVESYRRHKFPPANRIEVALGIIRPNRLDWAVEKLVELGVRTICPLICRYNSRKTIKRNHLGGVAVSAVKQSGQFFIPEILPPTRFSHWLSQVNDRSGTKLIFHANPDRQKPLPLKSSQPIDSIFVLIGPEGGFHPSEVEQAITANFSRVSLGANTLRTETAAVAAVSQIKLVLSQ